MKLSLHAYSNKGSRAQNEDWLDYIISDENSLFVLADGLGGHKNGKIASRTATDALIDYIKDMFETDVDMLYSAFLEANAAVLKKQKDMLKGDMKTTAVALCICGDNAIWGHVGDSRLYRFSKGKLKSVTPDHSVTYKKYLGGEISYRDIMKDEDRSSLLNVLGSSERCTPEILSEPVTLENDEAFLLCSDGFWEYVYEEEMLIDLLKSNTPKEWADHMLLRHIHRAKPSYDNLSLIAVFATKEIST